MNVDVVTVALDRMSRLMEMNEARANRQLNCTNPTGAAWNSTVGCPLHPHSCSKICDGATGSNGSTTVTNLPNSPQKERPPLTCPKK